MRPTQFSINRSGCIYKAAFQNLSFKAKGILRKGARCSQLNLGQGLALADAGFWALHDQEFCRLPQTLGRARCGPGADL